jgi:hypothetical protein
MKFATGTILVCWLTLAMSGATTYGQPVAKPADVLTAGQWERTDAAVDRSLSWLAAQQQPDGSFPTLDMGQPGVTGLCILAFMSHGHVPGEGRYGDQLARAVDYVAACQKENGLIALIGPEGPTITREIEHVLGVTAAYNHGIGSLVMSEVYGMSSDGERSAAHERVINRALAATLETQRWPKDMAKDRGGWRYIDEYNRHDSDLSITGWYLMFLRSARNAGFDVPKEPIDEAVAYVERCYAAEYGVFQYIADDNEDSRSRAMAGAGILALAHAGFHGAPAATQSGQFVLDHNFEQYNVYLPFSRPARSSHDRYHYSLFNCCQGMYQLGGVYWQQFFPRTVETLLANQQSDGSWPPDAHQFDAQFGNAYSTALVIMTLGAPNQLLPIFQR